jgi:hypothetical protein
MLAIVLSTQPVELSISPTAFDTAGFSPGTMSALEDFMPKSRRRKIKGRSRPPGGGGSFTTRTFLTNLDADATNFPDASSWPIARAYTPVPDVWRATGFGTAGIVREQPDGRWSYAFFNISLLDDGITGIFGKDNEDPEELDSFLTTLKEGMPPLQEGSVDLAAEYIWGAYAYSLKRGQVWPPGLTDSYLNKAPKPPGVKSRWVDRLVGPGGLTPHGLMKVVRENAALQEETPERKEVAIFAASAFRIEDAGSIVERLRARTPDFSYAGRDGDAEIFNLTREYPTHHWNPLKALGGRQVLGTVTVEPDRLTTEAKVLSMAARLIALLKEMMGEQIRLEETTWQSLNDPRVLR